MKNSADLGGCYQTRWITPLRDLRMWILLIMLLGSTDCPKENILLQRNPT